MFAGHEQTSVPLDFELVSFATWDPAKKTTPPADRLVLSNGDLTVNNTNNGAIWGTEAIAVGGGAGQLYFETKIEAKPGSGTQTIGLGRTDAATTAGPGYDTLGWGYDALSGSLFYNNGLTAYGVAVPLDGYVGVAFDADAGDLWFSVNGVWQVGDPVTRTDPAFTGLTGTLFPMYGISASASAQITSNFGQNAFVYGPPAGFLLGWGAGS